MTLESKLGPKQAGPWGPLPVTNGSLKVSGYNNSMWSLIIPGLEKFSSKLLIAKAESRVRVISEAGWDVRVCPVGVNADSSETQKPGRHPACPPPPLSLAVYPGAGRVVCRPPGGG